MSDQLLHQLLRYYNINKIAGVPYEKELHRLKCLDWLSFERLVFPYEFVDKYTGDTKVFSNSEGIPHVILPDKRKLYFPKEWDKDYVKLMFKLILIEQDIESPHHYLPIKNDSDITLDIGCAEANFTILNLINSREFHLFDSEEFHDAIHKTFKENNNVVVHSNIINEHNKIDSIKFNGKVDNIKIDVEGMEYEVLVSARQTIFRDKPDIQVCVYHTQNQFDEVYTLLRSFGYSDIKCSSGYMIFPNSFQEPPYFRKGVLYAHYVEENIS